MATTPTPTRKTSESSLDEWNRELRSSPTYLDFMRANGLPTDGRVKLSRGQQSALEDRLREAGTPVPKGMHIDQGGNLNQKNRTGRNVAIAAGIAAGGYFAAPYIAGALAGSGAGAGGAAGAAGAGAGAGTGAAAGGGLLASTALPTGLGMGASLGAIPTAGSLIAGGAGSALAGGALSGAGASLGGGSTLAGGGGGLGWGKMASKLMDKDTLGDIGAGLGAEAESRANERGTQADYALTRAALEPARSQENRAARGQAWKDLQRAEYMLGRKLPTEAPGHLSGAGSQYYTPGGGRFRDTTDAERTGAEGMRSELLKRLTGGPELERLPDMPQAGKLERGMSWGARGLGLLSKFL